MSKKAVSRHRRGFFTIHVGHILDESYAEMAKKNGDYESTMYLYFQELKAKKWPKVVRAMAIALEVGSDTKRVHVQGYVELKSGRTWNYYENLFGAMSTCFQTVRDAPGAWRYCSGQDGQKEGVLETWSFGEPILHANSESKADLKKCVSFIVDGYHPTYILREFPYAYTVHGPRIWYLWRSLQQLKKTGTIDDNFN